MQPGGYDTKDFRTNDSPNRSVRPVRRQRPVPRYRYPLIKVSLNQGSLHTGIPLYRRRSIQTSLNTGVPKDRSPLVQASRDTGVPNYRRNQHKRPQVRVDRTQRKGGDNPPIIVISLDSCLIGFGVDSLH